MRSTYGFRATRPGSFRARLEALEQRQCLSVTVATVGTELRITGDADDDTIDIVDSGAGHIDVTGLGGAVLGAGDAIQRIRLNSGDGSDTVSYALSGPLTTPRTLIFRLGDGDTNSATFDLSAGINANLRIDAAGGDGEDTLGVTLGVITDADVQVKLDGKDNNDTLTVSSVSGVAGLAEDGGTDSVNVDLLGGRGDDTLSASLAAAANVHLDVDMDGGSGDDDMSLIVTGTGAAEATTLASGSIGRQSFEACADPGVYVDMNGGSGDDVISASLEAGAAAHAKLDVDGASGDDEISVNVSDVADGEAPSLASGLSSSIHSAIHDSDGLYVDLAGGGGDDTMSSTVSAAIVGRSHIAMDGGSGDDDMTMSATGDIEADASLCVKMDGSSGDDVMNATVTSLVLGSLKFSANGGGGDDTMVNNITAAIGSTGQVKAIAAGLGGTDEVTLNVIDLSGDGGASLLASLEAKILDPGGHDTLVNTPNVEVVLNASFGIRGCGQNLNVMEALDHIFDQFGRD